MGEIKRVLTADEFVAAELPYAGRLVIEDCVGETIHLHIGSLRSEFTPKQFLWFAEHIANAAAELRVAMNADGRL